MEKKKYSVGNISISVSIPADIKEALEELAEKSGVSRNRLIISAIREMLSTKKIIIK